MDYKLVPVGEERIINWNTSLYGLWSLTGLGLLGKKDITNWHAKFTTEF